MAKTRRKQIEDWLDNEGWQYTGSARAGDTVGTVTFLGLIATFIFIVVSVLVTGDPFSGWVRSESDEVVPWFEEALGGVLALVALVMGLSYSMEKHFDRYRSITREFQRGSQNNAVNTYRGLTPDEQARLKKPLVDFLMVENADVSNPVFVKHRDAWRELKDQVTKRQELLQSTQALNAGSAVFEYAESVRNEIDIIRKSEAYE